MLDVGDTLTLTASPVDEAGNPCDIASLAVTVTLPDGTSTTPTVAHTGLGSYTATYVTTQAGRHLVSWLGTGWAYTDVANVYPADPRFLFSLDEARRFLRWTDGTQVADNETLRLYLAAVTPVIEDIVGPLMISADRTYTADGGAPNVVLPATNITISDVSVGGISIADWSANLAAGVVYAGVAGIGHRRFLRGRQNVVITYRSASTTIPPNVLLAAKELLRHLWQIGQQGNRPPFGESMESEAFTPSGFAVPRRVIQLCAGNRRAPGIA